jgi:hypothetical protein
MVNASVDRDEGCPDAKRQKIADAETAVAQGVSGVGKWEETVLPQQHLWAAVPKFFRCLHAPLLTFTGLGDPAIMRDIHERFEPRSGDVHVVTYPKAGTSWIQEIVWLVNHDADLAAANSLTSNQRTVYIELVLPGTDKIAELERMASPRHVKWHHPPWLLPPAVVQDGKIVYLMRNPKDTVVSWYHFQRMNKLYEFRGSFDEFFELFLKHDTPYGSYWHNVLSWWALRERPNILFLTYEDLHKDLAKEVRRIAEFLGKELTSEQVSAIVAHTSFDRMRANPMTNASKMPKVPGETDFMRKGQVGDWKRYFSADQNDRMDAWIAEHLKSEKLPLVYEQ